MEATLLIIKPTKTNTNKTGLYDEGIILCIKLAKSSFKSFRVGGSAIMCKQAPTWNGDNAGKCFHISVQEDGLADVLNLFTGVYLYGVRVGS